MGADGKLAELIKRCECGVYVTVNAHRDYYETVEQNLRERAHEIDADVLARMMETNTVVEVQFYPDTPIGSYSIYHFDLDAALDQALAILAK